MSSKTRQIIKSYKIKSNEICGEWCGFPVWSLLVLVLDPCSTSCSTLSTLPCSLFCFKFALLFSAGVVTVLHPISEHRLERYMTASYMTADYASLSACGVSFFFLSASLFLRCPWALFGRRLGFAALFSAFRAVANTGWPQWGGGQVKLGKDPRRSPCFAPVKSQQICHCWKLFTPGQDFWQVRGFQCNPRNSCSL